jgi:hypothetical protein
VPNTLRHAIESQLTREWAKNKTRRTVRNVYNLDDPYLVWQVDGPVYAWCFKGNDEFRHMYACGCVRDRGGWEQERRLAFVLGTSKRSGADSHVSLVLPEIVRQILCPEHTGFP